MPSRLILALMGFLLLSACSGSNQPAPEYTLVRPLEFGGQLILPGGEVLNDKDFRYFFNRSDYVLLGESHTNVTDHMSQAVILTRLAKQRLRPVLALEMLDVEQQPVLDRFNAGGMTLDELAVALEWSKNVGYSFDLYRPVLEAAVKCKVPLYALNIPRRVVRDARLNGLENVAAEDRKYIPSTYMAASEAQQVQLRGFFRQHMGQSANPAPAGLMPGSAPNGLSQDGLNLIPPSAQQPALPKARPMPPTAGRGRNSTPPPSAAAPQRGEVWHLEQLQMINGFIRAQSLWDSFMAARAMELHRTLQRPVVIIAGTGHVEYGWGIALRLRTQEPEARVICVMPWRAPLEGVLTQNEGSLLLAPEQQSNAIPTPDLADAYYYSSAAPVGKSPWGMLTVARRSPNGVQVTVLAVDAKSAAQKAGLAPGDVILRVSGRKVEDNADFYYLLAQLQAYDSPINITVLRGQEQREIILPRP